MSAAPNNITPTTTAIPHTNNMTTLTHSSLLAIVPVSNGPVDDTDADAQQWRGNRHQNHEQPRAAALVPSKLGLRSIRCTLTMLHIGHDSVPPSTWRSSLLPQLRRDAPTSPSLDCDTRQNSSIQASLSNRTPNAFCAVAKLDSRKNSLGAWICSSRVQKPNTKE